MSKNFTVEEFCRSETAKRLGIANTPSEAFLFNLNFTLAGLERVRAYLGSPMEITSGYRSPKLNEAVGGSATSQHMLCQAADFVCPGFGSPEAVVRALAPWVKVLGVDQLILEATWVHVSFSLNPRYQTLRMSQGKLIPFGG